jgi:hypothetical protein
MEATKETAPEGSHASQSCARQAELCIGFCSGLQMEFLLNMIGFSSRTGKFSEEFSTSR